MILSELKSFAQNYPDVHLWYRDDDVRIYKTENIGKLVKACIFASQNNIESLFSVIPDRISKNTKNLPIEIMKLYGVKVGIHGITHKNNANNGHANEFPEDIRNIEYEKLLKDYYHNFSDIFKNYFVPVFVAPFNYYSDYWEKVIIESGFKAISAVNPHYSAYSQYNIDIDIINWRDRRYHEYATIITKIKNLILLGKKRIGILNHFWFTNEEIWSFLAQLFSIFNNNRNLFLFR